MDVTPMSPPRANFQHGFTDFSQSDTTIGHTEGQPSVQPPVDRPADYSTTSFEYSISSGPSHSYPVAHNVVASHDVETPPQSAITEGDSDIQVVDEKAGRRPVRSLPSRFRRAVPSSLPKLGILDTVEVLDSAAAPEAPAPSTASHDDDLEDFWSSGSPKSSARPSSLSLSSNIYEEGPPSLSKQRMVPSSIPRPPNISGGTTSAVAGPSRVGGDTQPQQGFRKLFSIQPLLARESKPGTHRRNRNGGRN